MTPRRATTFFATVLIAVITSGPVFAQKWEYLGEANIDGSGDHDKIRVGDREGLFRAIRFHIERGAVNFDVVAHFESGEDDMVPLRATVPAGGTTRRLDLRGDKRKLDSVEVWYRRGGINRNEKPKIRLMGIRWQAQMRFSSSRTRVRPEPGPK